MKDPSIRGGRPNDSRAITNALSSTSSPSNNSFKIQQMAALLKDKINIRMSRLEKRLVKRMLRLLLSSKQSRKFVSHVVQTIISTIVR
ncbi:hypothetical protein Tco_0068824 [Tanacetum coccineum]